MTYRVRMACSWPRMAAPSGCGDVGRAAALAAGPPAVPAVLAVPQGQVGAAVPVARARPAGYRLAAGQPVVQDAFLVGHHAAAPSSRNAPSMAARMSRSVCWAASPAAVSAARASCLGDGPGGDHAGDAAGRAVQGDPAAAFGGVLHGAQVRGEQRRRVMRCPPPRRAGAGR